MYVSELASSDKPATNVNQKVTSEGKSMKVWGGGIGRDAEGHYRNKASCDMVTLGREHNQMERMET